MAPEAIRCSQIIGALLQLIGLHTAGQARTGVQPHCKEKKRRACVFSRSGFPDETVREIMDYRRDIETALDRHYC